MNRLTFVVLGLWILSVGCAPIGFKGEPPKDKVTNVNIESVTVYDNWKYGGSFDSIELTGGIRTDESAQKAAEVFKDTVISRLKEAGFFVSESSNTPEDILGLRLEMAHIRAIPLIRGHVVAEIIKGFVNNQRVFETHMAGGSSWVYSQETAVRGTTEAVVRALIDKLK